MKPCFADSFYFFAMLNPNDEAHAVAVQFQRSLRRPLVTTRWVLTEVGDRLATTLARQFFPKLIDRIEQQPRIQIACTSDELFALAVELYRNRPD